MREGRLSRVTVPTLRLLVWRSSPSAPACSWKSVRVVDWTDSGRTLARVTLFRSGVRPSRTMVAESVEACCTLAAPQGRRSFSDRPSGQGAVRASAAVALTVEPTSPPDPFDTVSLLPAGEVDVTVLLPPVDGLKVLEE